PFSGSAARGEVSATTLLPLYAEPGRTRRKCAHSGSSVFLGVSSSWCGGVSPRSGFVISRLPVSTQRVALEAVLKAQLTAAVLREVDRRSLTHAELPAHPGVSRSAVTGLL